MSTVILTNDKYIIQVSVPDTPTITCSITQDTINYTISVDGTVLT